MEMHMNYPMYGWGPPPIFGGSPARAGPTLDDVMYAEKWLKDLKKELKEEGKDKDDKKEKKALDRKFNILETTGLLMLLSFPVAAGQYLLVINILENIRHAIH
jgi:hypothetical protein